MHLNKEELDQLPDTMSFGSLVTKGNMSKEDTDVLLYRLFSENQDLLLIRSMLGSDKKMIQFLDIMAGLTLKIPTHNIILKTINEIEIWRNLRNHGYSQERVKELSSMYKIPSAKIKIVYDELEERFGDGRVEEE